jgi:hypothetical protein
MSEFIAGALFAAVMTLLVAGNCGAYETKQSECTAYCRRPLLGAPRYDGSVTTFSKHGYECRCANLQAVKP